jgi:hypothetical protein
LCEEAEDKRHLLFAGFHLLFADKQEDLVQKTKNVEGNNMLQ